MNQEQINNFHNLLLEHCEKNGYKISELLALLSTILVGTMAVNNCSEEFFNSVCDHMRDNFKNKRQEMKIR